MTKIQKILYGIAGLIAMFFLASLTMVQGVSPLNQNFGGTATSTIPATNSVIIQTGSGYGGVAPGSAGYVLLSNGAGLPPSYVATSTLGFSNITSQGQVYQFLGNASAGVPQWITATSTGEIHIDGNSGVTTQNGSILFPFQTLSQAIASSTNGAVSYGYTLDPGTYVDGPPDTFPSTPFFMNGNESTYVPASGVTFPGSFDIYDLTIVGNVMESDNSLSYIHQFNNGYIQGNVTLAGLATFTGMSSASTSNMTILPGALTNVNGSAWYAPISDYGILNLNDDQLSIGSNSSYALTATTTGSQVYVNGATIINTGTGGGINVNNGATSSPNEMTAFNLIINTSTPAGILNAGNAATVLCAFTSRNLQGTTVYPSGTNWQPCIDASLTVMATTTLVSATTSINSILYYWPSSQGLSNTVLTNDGNGNLSWGQGGGGSGSGGGWATSTPYNITNTYGTQVGINSTTPIGNLVVEGKAASTTPIFVVASSTNSAVLQVSSAGNTTVTGGLTVTGATTLNTVALTWPSSNSTGAQVLQNNGSGTLSWVNQSAGGAWSTTTNAVYNNYGQMVGINTSTPAYTLVIASTSVPTLDLYNATQISPLPNSGMQENNLFIQNLNNGLSIYTGFTVSQATDSVITIRDGSLFIGNNAGKKAINIVPAQNSNLDSSGNTMIGYEAGQNIVPSSTATTLTGAYDEVGLGSAALNSDISGQEDTAIGDRSLGHLTTGNFNTAVGVEALNNVINGTDNVAVGDQACNGCTGSSNTAIGQGTIFNASTASNNTVVGSSAGNTISSGIRNALFGSNAGVVLTTGQENVLLGANAGFNLTSASNNIVIGYGDELASTTIINQLDIGNLLYGNNLQSGTVFSTISTGQIGIGTSTPIAKFSVLASSTDASIPILDIASSTGAIDLQVSNTGITGVNLLYGLSGTPTYATSTGIGGTTASTVTITGTNEAGTIAITTATAPATGATILTLTTANSISAPTKLECYLHPENALTATLAGTTGVYVTETANTFTVTSGSVGLTGASTYQWGYNCDGY